jgi:hypothetical protein
MIYTLGFFVYAIVGISIYYISCYEPEDNKIRMLLMGIVYMTAWPLMITLLFLVLAFIKEDPNDKIF